jgi:23S rRNA pseudouridine1911/1915/1917 synthase
MVSHIFSHSSIIPENLHILYEDNHLIAVYKPSGVLVQGDISGDLSLLEVTKQYIKKTYQKPGNVFLGLIHRLDRPVSGVVLFAKTSKGAARISAQMRARSITKIYWALVYGKMDPAEGALIHYVKRDAKGPYCLKKKKQGAQKAVLTYRTLSGKRGKSLLEVNLLTGRKHQIRIQLSGAGCPIVGDVKYGAPLPLTDRSIRLIAKSLTFRHPTRDEIITIEAPSPKWAKI